MSSPPSTTPTAPWFFSGWGLLLSNLLTMGFAVVQNWSLSEIMLVYWFQSVIIGFFHVLRMLLLPRFCTEGFTGNGRRVEETARGKIGTAFFFAVHYGAFHLGYVFFIIAGTGSASDTRAMSFRAMLITLAGFVISHGISFVRDVKEDRQRRPNLGSMMFLPYLRIIPMHLVLVAGGTLSGGNRAWLFFFLVLKTITDLLFHYFEQRIARKASANMTS